MAKNVPFVYCLFLHVKVCVQGSNGLLINVIGLTFKVNNSKILKNILHSRTGPIK